MSKFSRRDFLKTTAGAAAAGTIGVGGATWSADAFAQGKWTPDRARDIDAFLARGGGLVYIHYAVDGGADAPGFAQRIGLAWQDGRSKYRHGTVDLDMETPLALRPAVDEHAVADRSACKKRLQHQHITSTQHG